MKIHRLRGQVRRCICAGLGLWVYRMDQESRTKNKSVFWTSCKGQRDEEEYMMQTQCARLCAVRVRSMQSLSVFVHVCAVRCSAV